MELVDNCGDGERERDKDGSSAQRMKRKAKKALIVDLDEAAILESWTQCKFFIKHKRRPCNLARCEGSLFCGTHRPAHEGPGSKIEKQCSRRGVAVERCPCPVDPSHSIYRHNLEAHVKICNITTRDQILYKQPYYRKDCNSGEGVVSPDPTDLSTTIEPSEQLPSRPLVTVNAELLLEKVRRTFALIEWTKRPVSSDDSEEFPVDPLVNRAVLDAVARYQSAGDKLRHAQQDALIVQQMVSFGLLDVAPDDIPHPAAANKVYVELGAGKGMLGLAVSSVCASATIVLVERSGMRRKADKIMRESGRRFYRARMDIRHCFLPNLPGVNDQVLSNSSPNPTSHLPYFLLYIRYLSVWMKMIQVSPSKRLLWTRGAVQLKSTQSPLLYPQVNRSQSKHLQRMWLSLPSICVEWRLTWRSAVSSLFFRPIVLGRRPSQLLSLEPLGCQSQRAVTMPATGKTTLVETGCHRRASLPMSSQCSSCGLDGLTLCVLASPVAAKLRSALRLAARV